jgi:hypothetical protein
MNVLPVFQGPRPLDVGIYPTTRDTRTPKNVLNPVLEHVCHDSPLICSVDARVSGRVLVKKP